MTAEQHRTLNPYPATPLLLYDTLPNRPIYDAAQVCEASRELGAKHLDTRGPSSFRETSHGFQSETSLLSPANPILYETVSPVLRL